MALLEKILGICNTLSILSSCFMKATTKSFLSSGCFDMLKKIHHTMVLLTLVFKEMLRNFYNFVIHRTLSNSYDRAFLRK